MHHSKTKIKQVIYIAIATVLLLEAILRVMGLRSMVLYECDSEAGYRLKPNQTVRIMGNDVRINDWGVRDPRPLDARSGDMRRVLVLGDSVTWGGPRIRQEELFTSILEQRLGGAEVINAGINGYSVAQMAALYSTRLRGLAPDVLLAYAIPRDFERAPRVCLARDSVVFPMKTPWFAMETAWGLFRLQAGKRLGWAWLEGPPPAESADGTAPGRECIPLNIQSLAELYAQLDGQVDFHVVLAPPAPGEDSSLRNEVIAALHEAEIPFIDLADSMQLGPENYVDGVHLNAQGHLAVGEALAAALPIGKKTG